MDNEADDQLFDSMLKAAISEALKKEMESLPPDDMYKTSSDLDKRIKNLINNIRME